MFQVAQMILSDEIGYGAPGPGGSIVLNQTAEFCRTLGDIPTYGLSGNRDEDAQEMLASRNIYNNCKNRYVIHFNSYIAAFVYYAC